MNKTELISKIAGKTGYTKKDTGAVVDALVEAVIEANVAGEEVSIAGFGKFGVNEVAERTGIIQLGDRKGETYVTPAHKAPKFKAATAYKEAVK